MRKLLRHRNNKWSHVAGGLHVQETMDGMQIRAATSDDCEAIADMIQELAASINWPDGPQQNAEALRRDGFGEEKLFHCLVAEDTKGSIPIVVGHAMYFYQYSAWEGCCVFLDDLYVKPGYRRAGIGTELWREVAKIGVNKGCRRMDWHCTKSNSSSIVFYKRNGGVDISEEEGWCLFRLRQPELEKFAAHENIPCTLESV